MTDKHLPQALLSVFPLFQCDDGRARIECLFQSDTLWFTQASMAELDDKDVSAINEHLINIFAEGELVQNSTMRKIRIVRQEGKRQVSREIEHYKGV
ncbi:hypothetical protein [Serratia ureilytica]|nr:hypothetical protein [Serratia ureilytica]MCC4106868.1 hypothetical protein [Serratia ureilytica]